MVSPVPRVVGLLVSCVFASLACTPDETSSEPVVAARTPAPESAPAPPAERPIEKPVAKRRHPASEVALPFEFPEVETSAEAGDRVLVPARTWIDEALERGVENQAFVFDPARMVEPGVNASVVEAPTGKRMTIPNALVIAIRKGQRAKAGDVVLTYSKAGLDRALVTDDSDPARPRAVSLDRPASTAKPRALPQDGFHRLGAAASVGTTVACGADGEHRRWIVVARSGPTLLLVGYGGRLHTDTAKNCRGLPIVPDVAPGEAVSVARLGRFESATVVRVEDVSGRVVVRAGARERSIGFANVATTLSGGAAAPPARPAPAPP